MGTKNCFSKRVPYSVISTFIVILYGAFSGSSQAENTQLSQIEPPIRIIFEFKNDGTRHHLYKLDEGNFFSLEEPLKFSDADMVVYKVDGWNALESVPNAQSIQPLIERVKKSNPETVTNMMVVEVGDGRTMAFLFINIASHELNAECSARVIYESIVDINSEWFDNSGAFEFSVDDC